MSKLLKNSQQTHNVPARYDPLCPQCDRMWRAGSVQGGRLPEYTHPPRYTPRVEARIEEVPPVPLSDVEEELFHNIL